MENEDLIKTQIEKTLDILKKLPDNRRVFYNTGILMVEVSKEEAKELLRGYLIGGSDESTKKEEKN